MLTRKIACTISLLIAFQSPVVHGQDQPATELQRQYQGIADSLIRAALADSAAWHRVAELVTGSAIG